MELWHDAGFFAKLTVLVGLSPLGMAIAYVVRPTENRLALMRPFSLAGIFAALAGGVVGFLNTLRSIGMDQEPFADSYRRFAVGAAESLVPMFVAFSCLTVAWLLVAVGMNRAAREV